MLADHAAVATVAVRDLAKAKAWYADTLGLPLADERPGVLTFKAGGHILFVYQSAFAGTNQATAVTWSLPEVDAVAAELRARGVAFEHYDNVPELQRDGDIYRGHGMAVCWFKDPDGNIHSLVSGG